MSLDHPLRFQPQYRRYLWGGREMVDWVSTERRLECPHNPMQGRARRSRL